jgi:hypothetical protein
MTMARAKVFVRDGNRFIVPRFWYCDDDEDASPESIICEAMMFAIVTNAKTEPDWLEIPIDDAGRADLLHLPYRLVGQQFAHGACSILLIGGPLFDANVAQEDAEP